MNLRRHPGGQSERRAAATIKLLEAIKGIKNYGLPTDEAGSACKIPCRHHEIQCRREALHRL
jgi:hypothetical protein